MTVDREYSLADIAVMLQHPIEAIIGAKVMLGIWPTRRDAAGQPFFDKAGLSCIHRLLVEKDGTVLFERRDPEAWTRYLKSAGIELTAVPRTAEQQAADDEFLAAVLTCDWDKCEQLMPPFEDNTK